jgi:hypothetical protein
MGDISILIYGVLIVAAVLAITSALVALAPYVAGTIVICGLFWFYLKFSDNDDPPPIQKPVVKPKTNLRE